MLVINPAASTAKHQVDKHTQNTNKQPEQHDRDGDDTHRPAGAGRPEQVYLPADSGPQWIQEAAGAAGHGVHARIVRCIVALDCSDDGPFLILGRGAGRRKKWGRA